MYLQEVNFKINLSYNDKFIQDNDAHARQLMFAFWGIIIPIISVVGFFGNLLTIIVLFRREMQSTTIYFLRTLVVTDTAIIIGGVVGLSVIAITQRDPSMWLFTDVIYPHIYTPINYIVMALQMINVWVTVAVAVERYIAICHPFKSVKICTKKNAFISLTVIVVISVLYNIPRCFATTAARCGKVAPHQDCFQLITTDFGNTFLYTQIYFFWMYMILIFIIPLVVLSVLNTLLVAELMRMRRRRTPSNVQENQESNMSVVLVIIVLVFIFCQTPGLCAQFTFWEPRVLVQWTCVSNTLFMFNSSVNFLIYTAAGRKFRKVLLKTFQVLIKKPANEFAKVSHYSQNGHGGTELRRLNTKPSDFSSEDTCTDEKSRLKSGR